MDLHRLIDEVKQRPALWDASHPDHPNRVERQRHWRSVADALGLKVEFCRSKWKNLRCSYRRKQHRRQGQQQQAASSQWPYEQAMRFLEACRIRSGSSNNEDDDDDPIVDMSTPIKTEPTPADEMEADNDVLMEQFQSMATPQAMRRLSHNISLASAAAEEQATPPETTPTPTERNSAMAAAATSSCQCAKRVDEQVHFLENLEREEQQLMLSTNQDLARCKNILHVGDSDYNFLISFLPLMKQMSPLQNVTFRAKMGELLLQTVQQPPLQLHQAQKLEQPEQPQPSQMLLNQQQMALDQAQQVSTSTSPTNWTSTN